MALIVLLMGRERTGTGLVRGRNVVLAVRLPGNSREDHSTVSVR